MARKRSRRTTYIPLAGKAGAKTRAQLREYAKFKPSLRKLATKAQKTGRLTSVEYGQFTRAKRQLRHTENLRPVTEKQAKKLRKKGLLVGHGIQAVRLRNTAPNAKIKVLKSGLIVTSNGRTWEYHPVAPEIDILVGYGLSLLDQPTTQAIALWTTRGRSDETFSRKNAWIAYLQSRFSQYVQAMDFTLGIAREVKPAK